MLRLHIDLHTRRSARRLMTSCSSQWSPVGATTAPASHIRALPRPEATPQVHAFSSPSKRTTSPLRAALSLLGHEPTTLRKHRLRQPRLCQPRLCKRRLALLRSVQARLLAAKQWANSCRCAVPRHDVGETTLQCSVVRREAELPSWRCAMFYSCSSAGNARFCSHHAGRSVQ